MIEKNKKQKCTISEEDVSNLLQRYTATTLLALLQEVAQSVDVKLNWEELVKKTSTGISNVREYQMLWRHLAYREGLPEKLEDGAEALDDDSDLECELEPSPSVSNEASAEAAACVKVLIASGLPSNSSLPNSSMVEAPLTINIPNGQTCRASSESSRPACSMQGKNITVPVSVQKNITLNDSLDVNGAGCGNNPRKRRKKWSEAEDRELIAAVNKYGPGNWANILREGDFKGDRTSSQLSQRYKNLIKRGNTNLEEKPTIPQLTEAQLATRSALYMALDRPKQNLTTGCTSSPALKTKPSTSVLPTATAETSDQAQNQSKQGSIATTSSPVQSLGSIMKSQITLKKQSAKSFTTSGSILDGARIGNPRTAASPFKAARVNNTIHFMSSSGSSIKPHMPGSASSQHEVHSNAASGRTGLSAEPVSTSAQDAFGLHSGSVRSLPTVVKNNPSSSACASLLNRPSQQCNAVASSQAAECQSKQDVEAPKEIKGPNSILAGKVQQNGKCTLTNEPCEGVKGHKASPEPEIKNQMDTAEHPNEKSKADNNQVDVTGCPNEKVPAGNDKVDVAGCAAVKEGNTKSAPEVSCENSSGAEKQAESSNKLEASSKSGATTAL
ncbi:hypothetical protein SLE2022_325290 [Rubroshorea leprosula]